VSWDGDVAERAEVSAERTLAKERHNAAALEKALANNANEQHCLSRSKTKSNQN
jgi:hypothetical protein